ncbi:MAG: efflux RND transporter periplasmic adaptor subunit [Acidobacteriota bacterium]
MTRETQTTSPERLHPRFLAWLLAFAMSTTLLACSEGKNQETAGAETKVALKGEHHDGNEVQLSDEALKAAKIELAEVVEESAGELLKVTGSVETNQELTSEVTPLVSGRVDRVNVALGDRVSRGAVLAVLASPQIAEMHGKLHEAETAFAIALRNLERVQKAENRVAVLQAKARLDEAEANLRRTQRLIALGAGAGKDLIAAETAHKTAKAEYEFQSNIALNREVAEARAAVDTARVDVKHMRDQLAALGAPVAADEKDDHDHDTSVIILRSPIAGVITERRANAGAGVEVGKPLFTVADISRLWVIANVPEARARALRIGAVAKVRAGDEETVAGRVTYIDPILNEETRTARVRVETTDPGQRFKIGSFVEVSFQLALGHLVTADRALIIPDEAVQRVGERTVVFIPKQDEAGHFEVREIEAGAVSDGMRRVTGGLKAGERVVTRGSFTLKTQLLKGELEDDH